MPGSDERLRCWAAAIRYHDALTEIGGLADTAIALREGGPMPPPEMGRRIVRVGGSLDEVREEWPAAYEALVRAREDAAACAVPKGYFDLIDSPPPTMESLEEPPETAEEANSKANTVLELQADLNEAGDDYYLHRPSG
jgi:hypothetical protein